MNFSEIAREVSKQLGRDNTRKARILQRSPHIFRGMDASEYAGMSSLELAKRELYALGIKADERSIEEQLLDAHHAGRAFARQSSGRSNTAMTSAQDGSSGGDSFIDKYINHE